MPETIKVRFFDESDKLAQAFLSHRDVHAYLTGHTQAADRLISGLARASGLAGEVSILAVGGYGRSELFPHSDIDIAIIIAEKADDALLDRIKNFVEMLWQTGLTIGHSVRTIAQTIQEAAKDVTVETALLEARLIEGDESLFAELQKAFFLRIDAAKFYRAKLLEMQQRHQKFENTPYSLEPNVKESPGGLRDLHVIFWCANAAGLGATPEAMQRLGTITHEECEQLKALDYTLKHDRILLHILAKRPENRLVFDLQQTVALHAGYRDTANQPASQALMKRYYLTAKTVTQFSEIFMQMLQEKLFAEPKVEESELDNTFITRGYTLDITDEEAFKKDPNAILRCFYLLESSQVLKCLGSTLLRALLRARFRINEAFVNDRVNLKMFLQILKMDSGVSHALDDLNQWGILGRFLPEFAPLVGQLQHDLFHVYTVDQHTMRVVRNLRHFTRSDRAHEYPLCSRIMMQGLKDNWRVVFAGLLHDIGKGRGGDHEIVGAHIAQKICERLGIDAETAQFLVFLVREHLTMSLVAQKQDLSNPEVIARFADKVGTVERLNALYLLTVADIRATSPKVWNAWKAQLIDDLYWQTLPLLTAQAPSNDDFLTERQRQAKNMILEAGVEEKTLTKIWKQLSLQYFLRHTSEGIAWQTIALSKVYPTDEPFVCSRVLTAANALEVMVYCPDQARLFARILAFLQKKRFSVLDARIYTTRNEYALDTFVVSDNGGRDLVRLVEEINTGLVDWLARPRELPASSTARYSRRSRHFPIAPIVNIEGDESGENFLLSVVCTDRIGLLYDIANILNRYGVNLQTAKIMTMGERVEDVFMIDGAALKNPETVVAIEAELIEVLTPKF